MFIIQYDNDLSYLVGGESQTRLRPLSGIPDKQVRHVR